MGPRRYNRLEFLLPDSSTVSTSMHPPFRGDRALHDDSTGLLGDIPGKRENEKQGAFTNARTSRLAKKDFGQLVALGFDVTAFTPVPYRRPRLGRPSMEISSCGRLRA